MDLKIIAEDDTLLVIDKPPGIAVWNESREQGDTVAAMILGQYPELESLGEERRYGIVHRLDKDTSGILLVAKTKEMFDQLQKQFAEREVEKQYICLVEGNFKEESGAIHTLLGRSPADRRKQRAYPLDGRPLDKTRAFGSEAQARRGLREAITEWRVLKCFADYTLLEATPKTGRKHQIRAHMASISHPIAGDKLYGFKNQRTPEGLTRHFLHASFLKVNRREFRSPLPEDLQKALETLTPIYDNTN